MIHNIKDRPIDLYGENTEIFQEPGELPEPVPVDGSAPTPIAEPAPEARVPRSLLLQRSDF